MGQRRERDGRVRLKSWRPSVAQWGGGGGVGWGMGMGWVWGGVDEARSWLFSLGPLKRDASAILCDAKNEKWMWPRSSVSDSFVVRSKAGVLTQIGHLGPRFPPPCHHTEFAWH